ncbi:NUDIX domain-containing protein [Oscillospiraceae bacterium MB08-C2-2]|nr:NUDIX domain-containing protein [Oscillospiraceae bacterium MB08-C2-2]
MIKEKSCGALVYRKADDKIQLLILKHKLGGHWSFPKGHVEEGETEPETALREVKEETGLTIELQEGFRERVTYSPRPHVSKEVIYFLGFAQDSRTKRQEEEISEIRWVDLEKVNRYLTYDNDRILIRNAKRHIARRASGDSPLAAKKSTTLN